jgi:signal transduction histidine kinase
MLRCLRLSQLTLAACPVYLISERCRVAWLGAGLGLAIALDIAKAHGGAIDVTSTLDEGTVFTVRLPAAR